MKPLFSIITVTYNAAATVVDTLKSVKEQSCGDYEVIVVDGASTDGTIDIINGMGLSNLTLVSEPDRGIYDAMNKGMSLARGTYLIFLNAGDSFHSADTLQLIAETAQRDNQPDIIYGQTQIVDSERKRVGERHLKAPDHLSFDSFKRGMLVCHQAFIAKASIAPRYNLDYRLSADYEWCLICLKRSKRNAFIDDYLIDFLNDGATSRNRGKSLRERYNIMCRYYGTVPTTLRHIRFLFRFLANKIFG